MRLVILGATGAGKSTQAKRLSEHFNVPPISTGELLRQAIAKDSELGAQAKQYLDAGELVPDQVMIQFMRSRLQQDDAVAGWILEGYPRTAFQAEELDFLLEELGKPLDWAIYLRLPEEVLVERSLERGNVDDTKEVIKRRLELFSDRTTTLLDYYEYKQKLLIIEGANAIDNVTQSILSKLG
ncbi:Adenylate kinase [Thalassoporum mexicanum PCC 7367]|uniref:adenylate kinase n=1 Tax=Thalassoporum mexicanum TaxID=3457544 RepID=UPI00029FF728|nr:adenylate kinase [Pseudanabaena sp. PCC 7367]AFY71770.1 Adenylate kinase [Pseudanabaena sp. PCC 7367]